MCLQCTIKSRLSTHVDAHLIGDLNAGRTLKLIKEAVVLEAEGKVIVTNNPDQLDQLVDNILQRGAYAPPATESNVSEFIKKLFPEAEVKDLSGADVQKWAGSVEELLSHILPDDVLPIFPEEPLTSGIELQFGCDPRLDPRGAYGHIMTNSEFIMIPPLGSLLERNPMELVDSLIDKGIYSLIEKNLYLTPQGMHVAREYIMTYDSGCCTITQLVKDLDTLGIVLNDIIPSMSLPTEYIISPSSPDTENAMPVLVTVHSL